MFKVTLWVKDFERFDILSEKEKQFQKLKTPHQNVFKETTLTSLLESMNAEEREDTLIIVFVAETDLQNVANISSLVEEKFPEVGSILISLPPSQLLQLLFLQHIQSGLLEVISPPPQFYPDLTELEETLGKPPKPNLKLVFFIWLWSD